MIEPLQRVLEAHSARQGWNLAEVNDLLLQALANAEGGPDAAAKDLDAFLTDLTAGEEPPDGATPRERCYEHLEALQELLTAGAYDLRPAAWIVLESMLERALRYARRAPEEGDPDPGGRFYAELSVPLRETMGFLEPEDEARIAAAFAAGGVADGLDTGSGFGFRDFGGVTADPHALLTAVAPLMPPDTQLRFRRMGGPGDVDDGA